MVVDSVGPGDPQRIGSALAARFAREHGRSPLGIFAAPGRVNLMGEHTDYNGGLCLPVALPHATYAAVAARPDGRLTVRSLQQDTAFEGSITELGPGHIAGWASYAAGVVWAIGESGIPLTGMDIVLDSRVPVGAGLSSSAALECAVALAVCAASDVTVDEPMRRSLVQVCMRAEAEVAGAPTGGMDQTISLLGRRAHALLLDCRDWSVEQVPWNPADADVELLVIDTRSAHALSDGGYASRRVECDAAASALGVEKLRDLGSDVAVLDGLDNDILRRRARHVLTEIARVGLAVTAIRADDPGGLGAMFTASHASLSDDFEVSCDELDTAVDTAVSAGALGARMTGGGFGGSVVALVPGQAVPGVQVEVARAFEARRWRAPGFLVAVPSAGASRLSG